jgi:hypothetical protein
VSHQALLSFALAKNVVHQVRGCDPEEGCIASAEHGAASRVFLASAHTFDVSLGDVVSTLAVGAVLCTAERCTVLERLGWCLKARPLSLIFLSIFYIF